MPARQYRLHNCMHYCRHCKDKLPCHFLEDSPCCLYIRRRLLQKAENTKGILARTARTLEEDEKMKGDIK